MHDRAVTCWNIYVSNVMLSSVHSILKVAEYDMFCQFLLRKSLQFAPEKLYISPLKSGFSTHQQLLHLVLNVKHRSMPRDHPDFLLRYSVSTLGSRKSTDT